MSNFAVVAGNPFLGQNFEIYGPFDSAGIATDFGESEEKSKNRQFSETNWTVTNLLTPRVIEREYLILIPVPNSGYQVVGTQKADNDKSAIFLYIKRMFWAKGNRKVMAVPIGELRDVKIDTHSTYEVK